MNNRKYLPYKIRHVNEVELSKPFSAHLCGSSRGFGDANALETYSNSISPTIKVQIGFIIIGEIDEQ